MAMLIKSPQVYVNQETKSIVYFKFDSPVIEGIIGEFNPIYSDYFEVDERFPFWKSATFQSIEQYNTAAVALKMQFLYPNAQG